MFQDFSSPQTDSKTFSEQRIAQLRDILVRRNINAFIVPRADAHFGEYVAPCDERLAFLTGFTGSAGRAVVTPEQTCLIVDGRYTLQAQDQAPSSFEIVNDTPEALETWLADALPKGDVVGFDPKLMSLGQFNRLKAALSKRGITLRAVASNPVDQVWGRDRPAPPRGAIMPHPIKYAGRTASDKVSHVCSELETRQADAVVLAQPDSICWLLNIRGSDIAHNPVVLAFAIVSSDGRVQLFVDDAKVTPAANRHLAKLAEVAPPEAFGAALRDLKTAGKTVAIDANRCSVWIARNVGARQTINATDPCVRAKAIKTVTEIENARTAQIRDGIAMARFLAWFDAESANGQLDEIQVAQKLESLRAENEPGALKDISFDTISGSGPNGAIVHYRVTEASNRRLKRGEFYLVDSGAQYVDGTTDITRTIAVGRPTNEMRRAYTLVLKGHIAIATARFPEDTRGVDLDPLARQALWQAGLDYSHGTGHGVGSYLSVHEGPQSISRRGMHKLEPGMILSNEPGYYKQGSFGIRIENLVLVKDAEVPPGGDRAMLGFETLTLAPIDTRPVDVKLMTQAELAWLNGYHAWVVKTLSPHLDTETRAWLRQACAKI